MPTIEFNEYKRNEKQRSNISALDWRQSRILVSAKCIVYTVYKCITFAQKNTTITTVNR